MLETLIPLVASGQATELARNGSPLVIKAAGRLLGLGEEERDALLGGRVPWWVWTVGGLAVGVVVGVQVYKRYPEKVPDFVKGW